MHRMKATAVTAAIGTLAFGAGTASAAVPNVSTGGANGVTADAARLHGTVNPRGLTTTYYFEYGTTRRYGSRTPDASAGAGTRNKSVSAAVGGLKPNTAYHYRIVASNPSGVSSGGDRSFTTRKQPLGLTLNASPNPIAFGAGTTVAGQLTGTGNANKQVVLQQRAFPFTAGFGNVGNAVVTDANGGFTFAALALPAPLRRAAHTTGGQGRGPVAAR